ncbi:hypothetical protein CY35_10G032400 [Sphagnum magellanicum]|nr:hypothetical protein CY35_10G032400 [Sphagnum magellanicum]
MAASLRLPSTSLLDVRRPGTQLCSSRFGQHLQQLQQQQQQQQVSSRFRSCAASLSVCAQRQLSKRMWPARVIKVKAQTEQSTEQGSTAADDEVCELVNGTDVELGEGSESFQAYFIQAIKNNNGAGVLLLTDVYGHQHSPTRDFVYRLACFGYNVLVPDLFRGNPWSKQKSKEQFEEWRATHPPDRLENDIDTSADWLSHALFEEGAVTKGLGIVGFCFGGGKVIQALARDTKGRYTTGVTFYGTRFDPALAVQIKVPLLLITGDKDPLSPVDVVRQVESQVKGAQARVYKGRGHGFVHMPESVEDDEDAEDAFEATRNWLHDHLLPQ